MREINNIKIKFMNLKEFVEFDSWDDSHVGYALQGYKDGLYIDVTHITHETVQDKSVIVLHLRNSFLISNKPCPQDLLDYAKKVKNPEYKYLAYEHFGKLYSFEKPVLADKNLTLCINGMDEKIAFDVGNEVMLLHEADVYEH